MGKVTYQDQRLGSPNQVTLRFRLQYTANGAADVILPAGAGVVSNTRTSEGLYTLTLRETYPVFIGGSGNVMPLAATFESAGGHVVRIDPADYVAATGVLTYRTGWADGVAGAALVLADIADNDWVYFELTFCLNADDAASGAI